MFKKFFFILSFCGWVMACEKSPYTHPVVLETKAGAQTIYVERADTLEKAQKGLMFRQSMPQNAGMLFTSDKEHVWVMWMKNTYIPLDMIFFNANGKITHMIENTTPQSLEYLSSKRAAKGVIEVNAGTIERLGVSVGDKIKHF